MESGSLSYRSALRKLCSPFSFWRSRSNGTPQDHAEKSRSLAWDYEKCKTEMMKKPQIRRIFDIMELDMLLLNLINLTTGKLKIESNQNQLKHLVELIKMNVELLIHEPSLQSISKLNLEELDGLLAASHTTQASTQHDHDPLLNNIEDLCEKLKKAEANAGQVAFDQNLIEDIKKLIFRAEYKLSPVKKIKEIYKLLKSAKAKVNAGEVGFGENLIKDIRRFIQQCHEEVQAEHQLAPSGYSIDPNGLNNDLAKLIVNFLPVELRPTLAKSNLNLVKCNLDLIMNPNLILLKEKSQTSSQMILTDKLINVTSNLINQINIQISRVDCRVSNLQDDSNWEQMMKSHAIGIIQLIYTTPKAELYINRMNSFKDICNQVAAMYKHSHQHHQKVVIEKGESERTYENYTWCGSFHKDIINAIRTNENYTWCGFFHEDIFNGNCEGVKNFLKKNSLALTAKITVDGNTALHVAVKAMKEEIVRWLSEKLRKENKLIETLKKQNEEGKTALYIAASSGRKSIIEELVKTNKDILLVECEDGSNHTLPLFVAAKYDHKDMVEYIYDEMQNYKKEKESSGEHQKVECFPRENPNDQKAKVWMRHWALFLANLIYNDDYDRASHILDDYPSLALSKHTDVETPLFALAQRPSLGANVTFHDKASTFQCPTFICGNKMDDGTASKASKLLEKIILTIDDLESQKPALKAAFFKAAEVGSVEFVAMFINSLPLVLSWSNDLYQNIFHVAIINRQENIFNLIYGLGSVKNDLTGSADKFNNWMLHLAGVIAPPNRLNQLPGPAMQLQRELQWFQVVKEIVPKFSIHVKNLLGIDGETPSELFTSTHKDLMKDGENWMRNTASQCSVVAALITTVMFAATFTLPGGNNQNTGDPMFLGDISFLLFAVVDFIALLTSCTSVLIFLAILTSRFAQRDFLISLPMRLFTGLVLLLVSMAAMIFVFCDTIYIIIHHQYDWFCIPIIIGLGLIPVSIFWFMTFPLLLDLWRATTASIFDKSPSPRIKYY